MLRGHFGNGRFRPVRFSPPHLPFGTQSGAGPMAAPDRGGPVFSCLIVAGLGMATVVPLVSVALLFATLASLPGGAGAVPGPFPNRAAPRPMLDRAGLVFLGVALASIVGFAATAAVGVARGFSPAGPGAGPTSPRDRFARFLTDDLGLTSGVYLGVARIGRVLAAADDGRRGWFLLRFRPGLALPFADALLARLRSSPDTLDAIPVSPSSWDTPNAPSWWRPADHFDTLAHEVEHRSPLFLAVSPAAEIVYVGRTLG